jgi:hypothetical protein
LGIGKICDNDCKVVFDKTSVTVFALDGTTLLQGWRETAGPKLWRFSLIPIDTFSPSPATQTPAALNMHDLPSVGALVHYLHAAVGFPVKSTWLAAIKAGNFASWPGLTYANASKFCPSSDETIKGHPSQVRQGLSSTKPRMRPPIPLLTLPSRPSKEMHIWSDPISKLFKTTWVASLSVLAAAISTSCWPITATPMPSSSNPSSPAKTDTTSQPTRAL